MLNRAASNHQLRCPDAALSWLLADGVHHQPSCAANLLICLGAEWIWHDLGGTARALRDRGSSGSTLVVGAGRRHDAADPATLPGRIDCSADQRAQLTALGLRVDAELRPDDQDWDRYLGRCAAAVRSWAHDGDSCAGKRWQHAYDEWLAARDNDRGIMAWSVWVTTVL